MLNSFYQAHVREALHSTLFSGNGLLGARAVGQGRWAGAFPISSCTRGKLGVPHLSE